MIKKIKYFFNPKRPFVCEAGCEQVVDEVFLIVCETYIASMFACRECFTRLAKSDPELKKMVSPLRMLLLTGEPWEEERLR